MLFIWQLVWVLYCDLLCLDYDGNITDACVLALLAALKNGKNYLLPAYCHLLWNTVVPFI